jgi:hypothetical protein
LRKENTAFTPLFLLEILRWTWVFALNDTKKIDKRKTKISSHRNAKATTLSVFGGPSVVRVAAQTIISSPTTVNNKTTVL